MTSDYVQRRARDARLNDRNWADGIIIDSKTIKGRSRVLTVATTAHGGSDIDSNKIQ